MFLEVQTYQSHKTHRPSSHRSATSQGCPGTGADLAVAQASGTWVCDQDPTLNLVLCCCCCEILTRGPALLFRTELCAVCGGAAQEPDAVETPGHWYKRSTQQKTGTLCALQLLPGKSQAVEWEVRCEGTAADVGKVPAGGRGGSWCGEGGGSQRRKERATLFSWRALLCVSTDGGNRGGLLGRSDCFSGHGPLMRLARGWHLETQIPAR